MSNITTRTFQIELTDKQVGDELIECIMIMRVIAKAYPQHLTIAYQSLEREYMLPPIQQAMESRND